MKLKLLIATGLVSIAGCGPMPTPVEDTTKDAGKQPAAVAISPAEYEIDQPIAVADIGAQLALVGVPFYSARDDSLQFTVEVTNTGKVPLVSAGRHPVRVAVILAGPEGVDKAPGTRSFRRAMLPLIAAGAKGQTQANVPVTPLLGMQVKLELVQEGVAWFGKEYNQPVLDVGTFQRCAGAPATLCDATGSAVAEQ